MTKVINLTPHEIVLLVGEQRVSLPPSGQVARVKATTKVVAHLEINGCNVPVVETTFDGDIEGLPPQEEGVIYLVSSLVAQAATRLGRRDVVAPDTSPAGVVRDAEGKIIGVTRLQRF